MPKISVIVPVYNTGQYLPRCIDSILSQTFTDFELLLIDDGSTDNSGMICDEYAAKDSRIRVFHKENGGVSSARNFGLAQASGEYIGWVDSDDWIEPNMYELLLCAIEREKADIAYCNFQSTYTVFTMPSQTNDKVFFLKKYLNVHVNSLCNTLISHKLYTQNNIKFIDSDNYGEDLLITTKLYYLSTKCLHVSKILYHYTDNPTSICNTANLKKKRELINNLQALASFFESTNIQSSILPSIAYRILNEKKVFLFQEKDLSTWFNICPWTHKYIFSNPYNGIKGKAIEAVSSLFYHLKSAITSTRSQKDAS